MVSDGLTKTQVQQKCREYQSELLTIESAAENEFIARMNNKNTSLLIGLHRTSVGQFRWSDGTLLNDSPFKNWYPGEPNNGVGDARKKCATLNLIFLRGDVELKLMPRYCKDSFLFVCEKEKTTANVCWNVTCDSSQHCVSVNNSPACICNPGYTNSLNKSFCRAANVCWNVTCDSSQHCVSVNNSPACICNPGYTSSLNKSFCRAKSPESPQLSKSAIIGISVSCSVVLLVCIVCVLYGVKRSRQKNHEEVENEEGEAILMPNILPADPRELLEGQLTMLGAIGEGAFGKVFKGTLGLLDSQAKNFTSSVVKGNKPQREITVAVKKLRALARDDQKQQFLEEIEMMKKLGQHKNIVNMIACCTNSEPFLLVVEYVPNGDLLNYLRKIRLQVDSGSYSNIRECSGRENTDQKWRPSEEHEDGLNFLELNDLLSVSWQISSGMSPVIFAKLLNRTLVAHPLAPHGEIVSLKRRYDLRGGYEVYDRISSTKLVPLSQEYLATKGFVHRDLAARNVLLGDNKVVKVADFGLSRRLYQDVYQMKNAKMLPMKWMPPESIFYQTFTTKSDVWAFGVLLWEITTLGGIPCPGLSSKNLVKALKRGYRMEKPEICSDEIYVIMKSCWSECPDDRPSFTQLREQLETMMERNTSYLNISTLEGETHTYYNEIPFIGSTSSSSDTESD